MGREYVPLRRSPEGCTSTEDTMKRIPLRTVAKLAILGAYMGVVEGTIRWVETHPDSDVRDHGQRLRGLWESARPALHKAAAVTIAHTN